MKIKLLKELPGYEVGHIFKIENEEASAWFSSYIVKNLLSFNWAEKIIEIPKTIWELQDSDEYYLIDSDGTFLRKEWNINSKVDRRNFHNIFLTKKEAQMELLRRESRAIAWKPNIWERYWTTHWLETDVFTWDGNAQENSLYHHGNVHKNEDEAIKWTKTYGEAFGLN